MRQQEDLEETVERFDPQDGQNERRRKSIGLIEPSYGSQSI